MISSIKTTITLSLIVIILAGVLFYQAQNPSENLSSVLAQEFVTPEIELQNDWVCDEVIPVGNVFNDTKQLMDDVFQEYRNAQVMLDASVRSMVATIDLMTSKSNSEEVCDYNKCVVETRDDGQVKNAGPDVVLKVDPGIGGAQDIAKMNVPVCPEVDCGGTPCNNLNVEIKKLKSLRNGFLDAQENVHKMLYAQSEKIGYDNLRTDYEDPEGPISRPDKIRRGIELVRNWLTPATGLRRSCAMTESDKAKAEDGRSGSWGPVKCLEARESQAYWPRAWSEKCKDKCTDDYDVSKECKECLADAKKWAPLIAQVDDSLVWWQAKKNVVSYGSILARLNLTMYGECQKDCKGEALSDKCVKCLCEKGTGRKDYTPEQCTAWLCGGSNYNWTCCREQGMSRWQASDLANMEIYFPTLSGDLMMRAKEVYRTIKDIIENDTSGILSGLNPDFALAIIAQETRIGGYMGVNYYDVKNMKSKDKTAFQEIIKEITGKDFDDLTYEELNKFPVSQSVTTMDGGAMGPMQIMPSTWGEVRAAIAQATGKSVPHPWELVDSLTGGMTYLTQKCGAVADEATAAKKYVAGPNAKSYGNTANIYSASVMAYKACFAEVIALGCFELDAAQTAETKAKCNKTGLKQIPSCAKLIR